MRLLKMMMAVAAVCVVAAGPALAQTTPPAQPPAKPTTPAPAPPAPAPPAAYPEGAKIAYVDLQAVASASAEGKAATAKIQELEKKKIGEIQVKSKQLEDARTKQSTGGSIMNEQARLALDKEVDKLTREVQYMQQEAQAERTNLQTELQVEFQRKLNPVLEAIGKEKALHFILDAAGSGAVWADPGLDVTAEVIKRLDSAKPAAAPPKK